MSKCKVLVIIVGIYDGGQERSALSLIEGLLSAGHQVGLITIKRQVETSVFLPKGLETYSCIGAEERIQFNLLRIIKTINQIVRRYDVIIGGTDLEANYLAAIAKMVTGKPAVGWLHTHYASFATKMSLVQRILIGHLYPAMNKLVILNKQSIRGFRPLRRITEEKICVIPNMFNLDRIRKSSLMIGCKYFKDSQIPFIIGIGRLETEKNFELLIRTHARLIKEGLKHNLLILGEGSLRRELEALTIQLNVEESVAMPGFVDNPYPSLRRSSVYVLCSDFEGFPRTLIESLCLGVPIIATDCMTGPREILANGDYGALIEPGNEDQLLEQLRNVLNCSLPYGKDLHHREKRAEEYSIENVLPKWQELLEQLVP